MKKKLIIAVRKSKLALAQANLVKERLKKLNPIIKTFQTVGDQILDKPIHEIGGKGVFIKSIEKALFEQKADIAVHSMKDMPATSHDDLEIFCFMDRLNSSDVLLSNLGTKLQNLESGSVIGTSSIRRRSQILNFRSDLKIKLLRGNVDTRINKLKNKEYDAIILAYAGLKRLGLENNITEILDQQAFLPAGGQGVVGIQSKKKC